MPVSGMQQVVAISVIIAKKDFEFVKVSGVFRNNYPDPHKRHGMGKLHSRQYRLVPVDLTRPNQIWLHGRKAAFLD